MRFSPAVKQSITKLLDIKSMKHMDNLSAYNPSPLTIKQFIEFGRTATEADSFHFLKREVPIRLANIMKEINLLPSSLLTMPSVIGLQQWYAASFVDLCAFEGRQGDRQDLKDFVDLLAVIAKRHANAVRTMAQGVMELKESHDVDAQTEASIRYFLDRFYMSRMSTRMLTNQHFVLFGPSRGDETRPNWIGVLDTNCRVKNIVDAAYTNASFLCEEYYNMAPDIDITLRNEGAEKNEPIEVCYPPQHLYHVLFELFKNSMRAVVEHKKRGFDLPDLAVLIAKGKSDVTIKISDQGGGIPRHIQEHLFHYLYSTAPRPSMQPTEAPLAGYGYGLPLSRLYARYLHGDLILNSYEGFGTDAVVYLKADDVESVELLPVFNMTSSKQYKSAVTAADWTDPNSNMNRFYHPRRSPRSKAARSS